MSIVRRSHAAALLLVLLVSLPAVVSHTSANSAPSSSSGPPPLARSATVPRAAPVHVRDVWVTGHARPCPALCPEQGARLRLLIMVTSAPAHAAARDAVRFTWGHYRARSDVALAFVIGAPPEELQPTLAQEDALYGDVVVGRSLDSYNNLTLKTLSMLEWAATYCPRAPRLLKTNDDMFINVPRLLQFLASPLRVNATRTIWGKLVRNSIPSRTCKRKNYVPSAQCPDRMSPDFVMGAAYLLTADCIGPLLAAAPAEKYMRLEHMFVTGVLAHKLRLAREHAPEFYNSKMVPHPCTIQRGISTRLVRHQQQFDFWRKLLDGMSKCSTEKV